MRKSIIISVIISSFLFLFFARFKNKETQICYGPTVQTEDLSNAYCIGEYDPKVYVCWDKFFFRKYKLSVSAPKGWHFIGEPSVNCVQDNQGSCAWNGGFFNRIITTQSSPTYKEIEVGISSRSIKINLKCEAIKG